MFLRTVRVKPNVHNQHITENAMKIHTYPFILLISLLLACSPAMPPAPAPPDASALYRAAAAKHYQLANGEIPSAETEWDSLIEEFDGIINADTEGEWADDAQYAIASCWLWLAQRNKQPALDNALTALKQLLQDYPNSPHAAEAHYWLGDCHDRLGDYGKAVPHYQTVISHHPKHAIADKAQLRLGKAYEAQGYSTLARITYQALSQQSKDPKLSPKQRNVLHAFLSSKPKRRHPSILHLKLCRQNPLKLLNRIHLKRGQK